MLKKYLNCHKASYLFLNIAMVFILVYSVVLTMFLSMLPDEMPFYEASAIGIDFLDSIFCACAVTSVCFLVIEYICISKVKK